MTDKEIWRILFESLLHKDITRVSYFNKQLEESNIDPVIFVKCLLDELKKINEYVESSSGNAWVIDSKTGEKKYINKNKILLNKVTEGKMMGQIDCNNINEIAKPLIEFSEFILKNDTQNSKQSKKLKKTSYVWLGNPENDLRELHKLMTNDYKLIASETTYEQFEMVFTGQPIEKINQIRWHQDNASELLYFINRLEESNNIDYNPKRADYIKLAACFVKPNGEQFNAVWKSLKTSIKINLSLNKQKSIDDLVSNF